MCEPAQTCTPFDRGQNSTKWTSLRRALGIMSDSDERQRSEKPRTPLSDHILPANRRRASQQDHKAAAAFRRTMRHNISQAWISQRTITTVWCRNVFFTDNSVVKGKSKITSVLEEQSQIPAPCGRENPRSSPELSASSSASARAIRSDQSPAVVFLPFDSI